MAITYKPLGKKPLPNTKSPALLSSAAGAAADRLKSAPLPATTKGILQPLGANVKRKPPPSMPPPSAPPPPMPGTMTGQSAGGMGGFSINPTGRDESNTTIHAGAQDTMPGVREQLTPTSYDATTMAGGAGTQQALVPEIAESEPFAGPTEDDLVQRYIREILGGGPRDTSEEEAAIRASQDAAANNAMGQLTGSLGRSGFGVGGAATALRGDMLGAAARRANEQIQGVRQGARDDYRQDAEQALGALFGSRNLGMQESALDAAIAALTGGDEGNNGRPEGLDPDTQSAHEQNPMLNPFSQGAGTQSDPWMVSKDDVERLGIRQANNDDPHLYVDADGNYYWLKDLDANLPIFGGPT